MACGLPVVASRTRSNLELLDSSVSMLVDPLNVGEIQTAIATLIDDPDRRRAMGQAALKRAAQDASEDRARSILDWIERPLEC
jgi:glycosyltransferase involved in cell wall biosynthesis